MQKLVLYILFFLITLSASFAQKTSPVCGTDFMGAQRYFLSAKTHANTALPAAKGATAPASATYTIPVVVVVYHIGEAVGVGSNISDSDIQGALDEMNRKFAGTSTMGSGPNAQIKFELAKRMPNCTAFNGIYRVDASNFPNYASQGITTYQNGDALARAYPPFTKANPADYLTIRVVRDISFAAGYAQMNGGDIFMVSAGANGNPGNGLLTHEMGHVLSLFHTFEGSALISPGQYSCPLNANPSTDGDQVADTNPHKTGHYTCDPNDPNSCTNSNYGQTLADNLMNYTCFRNFTQGQVTKMRDFLADRLPTLPGSIYLSAPTTADIVTPASCSITFGAPATGYVNGISRVQFNTITNFSEEYPTPNNTGGYSDFSCARKTTVQPNTSYPFSLTAYSPQRKVYIDYNNDGSFNETNELVSSITTISDVSSGNILIPTTAVTNTYLRMRFVVDNGATPPTACNLPGDTTYGYGEIEDYGILISAPCNQMVTVKSGQWNDPTVWSCNRVPTLTDIVTVSTGHTISVTDSTATSRRVIYQTSGRITFTSNGRLTVTNPL